MDIPDFLEPATRVRIYHPPSAGPAVVRVAGPASGGVAPGSRRLPFAIQPQEQTHWCWAAVSTSVSLYYDRSSAWTQCGVVDTALNRTDCCTDPAASDESQCNQDGYLELALKITGNFDLMRRRSLRFDEVQDVINKGHILGCRIEWTGDGGHFVALKGWIVGGSGEQYIEVEDPIYLDSRVAFTQFPSNYKTGADWTHSYRTKAVPAAGGALAQVARAANITCPEAIGA